MSYIEEFKKFAMRGNVLDLAVGVVIGGAFGKIVSSFVSDILMPPLGLLLGGIDFKDFAITLKKAEEGMEAVTLRYGAFVQNVIDFTIIAFSIFLLIKGINTLQKKKEEVSAPAAPPEPSNEEKLLAEIRDLLKNQSR